MVEFALVAPLFLGLVLFLIVLGFWIYNSSQTAQAARLAAYYAAWTNDCPEAERKAYELLEKSLVAAEIEQVSAYASGDTARSRVVVKMETFFPGLKKLFAPGEPGWTGRVTIEKEASTAREYRHRYPGKFG